MLRSIVRPLLILAFTAVVLVVFYGVFSRFSATDVPAAEQGTPSFEKRLSGRSASAEVGHDESRGSPVEATRSAEMARAEPASSVATSVFNITVDGAQPSTTAVIRVKKDDRVSISLTIDRGGVIEVHGYGKRAKVEAGSNPPLSFVADKTGRFPIDLHAQDGSHVEVAALEVSPR